MATLDRAIELAAQAHLGQRDKDGQPYILHPLRVMQRVQGEEAQIVAVLHDTLEDTSLTVEDLRREGFRPTIIDSVQLVTRGENENYADYVVRCSGSPVAKQVKLADLEDNAGLERVLLRPGQEKQDLARIHRYILSYKFLTGQLTEEQYRSLMASYG